MIGGVDLAIAGLAVVEEVGGREEAGDGLHPAGFPIHRVLGIRVPGVAGGPQHQREVAARRGTADPDPAGIDAVILAVVTDEPDGPIHVLDDLGDGEAGLAAVDHGEDRIAPIGQRSDEGRLDRLVRGDEAAADDQDHADPLGVLPGSEDVHGQSGAELAAVDHVFLAVVRRLVGLTKGIPRDMPAIRPRMVRNVARLMRASPGCEYRFPPADVISITDGRSTASLVLLIPQRFR